MASLLIESKLKCTTTGTYAYGCGGTWAGAHSFAGAAFEAYAAALAVIGETTECSCDLSLTAEADVSVSAFADIWTEIYASLDDFACASTQGVSLVHAVCTSMHSQAVTLVYAVR